ncbi:MAG: glycosyltransferase family 39 protein, partial [Oscillochloris sp.]|nr:glycosyltransferase family 39 protein [Oscillochloris sp.]
YDIGASGDAYVAVNFYPPELDGVSGASFRWSGPAAALLLPDPYTGAAIIALRLHGNPDRSPLVLSSASSALPALTIQPDSGWRTYHILAPREQLWGASGQPCWLHLDGVAVGAQAAEPRLLGVAVDTLRVTPLTAVPGPLWPPLRRALLLGWGLILVAASLWCMLWSLGLRPLRTRTGRAVLLLPLLAAVGICLWAARDSASLSWVLPLSPVALSVATVLLVALWAIVIWLRRERLRIVPRTWAITTAMVLGVAHLLLLLPSGIELRGVSALIILGVPGALLAHLLIPGMNDPLERLFLGLCGALALPVLLLLALQVVFPVAIAPLPLLVICDALSVLAGVLLTRREPLPTTAPGEHPYLALAILLLYAAALRLPFLGRSELHDDEATAIVAATRMVGGIPDQLLIQLKGPVQVLLPAGPMALIGQINEWVARMPFLLAGMGVVLGGYVLARQVLGGRPAWGALAVAAILTCDGFLIAFSRIVQYQSVVMLMGIGAFWCCWRFYQGSARPWPDLIAAAIMMAVGLLSHYDAIYVV